MSGIPPYKTLLTAGPAARIGLPADQQRFFAAVSDTAPDDDPPKSAIILYTSLDYPARLRAELRESLRRERITVVGSHEVTPEELERVYSTAQHDEVTPDTDLDRERYRDITIRLLSAAVRRGASDIHIVRRQRSARVSFRIHGQIIPHTEWSDDEADNTCRYIYEILAREQAVTWNPRSTQDAVIDTSLDPAGRVRVRVGTIPASPDGYDMVLRVLPTIAASLPLQQLGYTRSQLADIRALARRPSGLVIMAGAVGCGKSTSLIGMLHEELEVHRHRLRIITVEDPPERVIPHATQVPVIRRDDGQSTDHEFLFAIRGALRCDPDTLMVGEIRDKPAAELVIKFAQSGHRVYTTLHASSALGVVARLAAIGIEPALLCTSDVLKGMIFQTLVPVLCDKCKISVSSFPDGDSARRSGCVRRARSQLGAREMDASSVAVRGPGCKSCSQTGIAGRTLTAEIVVPDEVMMRHLECGDLVAAHDHWVRTGGKPVIEHGIKLMAAGRSAPADIEWRLGRLDVGTGHVARKVNGAGRQVIAGHA